MKFANFFVFLSCITGVVGTNLAFENVAYAESEGVCQQYAQDAVAAFNQQKEVGCGLSNSRWQSNYNNHLTWCRTAPALSVSYEQTFRRNDLKVCNKQPTALSCSQYAKVAVSQVAEANRLGCGKSGARWTGSYDSHLDWCLGVTNSDFPNSETSWRTKELDQCRNPSSNPNPGGSGPFDPPSTNQHCAASCNVCTLEGLRCTVGGNCSEKYPTTAPWLCY